MKIWQALYQAMIYRKKQVFKLSVIYLFFCMMFWIWAFAVVLGLGFKDPQSWSAAEQLQALMIPQILFIFTAPARFLGWDDGVGFVAGSLLWSALLVVLSELFILTQIRS